MFTRYLYFRSERQWVIYSSCTAVAPGIAKPLPGKQLLLLLWGKVREQRNRPSLYGAGNTGPSCPSSTKKRWSPLVPGITVAAVPLVGRRKSLQQQCSVCILCIHRHSCTTTRHYSNRHLVYSRLLRCILPGGKLMALHTVSNPTKFRLP